MYSDFFLKNNYTRITTQKSGLRLCIFFVLTLTRSPSCVACTDDDLSTKFSFDVLNSNGREMCVLYVSRMYTHTPNITTWYTKSIQTNRNKTKRNDTRMNKQRLCLCCVCVCTLTCTCTLDNLNDDHTLSCARTVEPLIRILIHLPFSFCRLLFCLLPCLLTFSLVRVAFSLPSFHSLKIYVERTRANEKERER